MENSLHMRVLHCARNLRHQCHSATRVAAQHRDRFEQTAAAGELHTEERQPFALADFINGQNVRVIEVGRSLRFTSEAHQRLPRIRVAG